MRGAVPLFCDINVYRMLHAGITLILQDDEYCVNAIVSHK
jgi:hypothetical protein